jgi:hypothetical protein
MSDIHHPHNPLECICFIDYALRMLVHVTSFVSFPRVNCFDNSRVVTVHCFKRAKRKRELVIVCFKHDDLVRQMSIKARHMTRTSHTEVYIIYTYMVR